MYRMREVPMTIPHADGKEDQIRLILPALMHSKGVEEEKEHIRSLVEVVPMAVCLPIRAWLRFLDVDEYAGGLEGEKEPISSGPPSGVLYDLAREAERRAGAPPLPDVDADTTIRPGLCGLHLMEIRGWKKELVRSCCAALRTHDGRASAQMRIEEGGKAFSLRVLEEGTKREAGLLLEFWSLPYVAGDVFELWGLPDGVGRVLENWEKIVGRVRYDAGQGLHFVRVGERGEIGFNLRTPDGLRELVDALVSLAEETP